MDVEPQEPRIVDSIQERTVASRLVDDLCLVCDSRGSADVAANLSLRPIPQIAGMLHELSMNPAAALTPAQENARAAAVRAECTALIVQCRDVQQKFDDYITEALLIVNRDHIAFETKMKENRERCQEFVAKCLEDHIRIEFISDASKAFDRIEAFRKKIFDTNKNQASHILSPGHLPTFLYTELGQIPAMTEEKVELPRSTPTEWKTLFCVIRDECVSAPATRAALIVYAKKGVGHRKDFQESRLLYNAGILEVMSKGTLYLDAEVHMPFARGGVGQDRRGARTGCLAKHRSARKASSNLWSYAWPETTLGELDWSFPRPAPTDYVRVQNLDSIRANDVLPGKAMGTRMREEYVSAGW